MSVNNNLQVDPTQVSVDTNLCMNATPDVSSGIKIILNDLFIHKSSVHFVENNALLDVINIVPQNASQRPNQPSDQSLAESVSQQSRRSDDDQN